MYFFAIEMTRRRFASTLLAQLFHMQLFDQIAARVRSDANGDTRRRALEGGAEALLTKPIDFSALRSEIDGRIKPGR
jgi:CheY-like chemotaxis protein